MKMTLIEMVQDILSDMDSDEVSSIDETTEAAQVAQIIKSTYTAQMASRDWPHLRRTVLGQSLSDVDRPSHVRLQNEITELTKLQYNVAKVDDPRIRMDDIVWLEPDEFLTKVSSRNSTLDNVKTVTDYGGSTLLIFNDQAPKYYTSFDDQILIFDAYDKEISTTIVGDRMQAIAYIVPEWTHLDESIPDLPDNAFPLLLEESKHKAMFKLKQMNDTTAMKTAEKHDKWLSRKSRTNQGGIKYQLYGRGGRGRGRKEFFKRISDPAQ